MTPPIVAHNSIGIFLHESSYESHLDYASGPKCIKLVPFVPGGDQDHRQDAAEPEQPPEALQRSPDHENLGPSKYCQTLSGQLKGLPADKGPGRIFGLQ